MDSVHEHNRSRPLPSGPKRYGLRYSLPPADPMRPVLGDDWHQYEWFATEVDREGKIAELTRPFLYYRKGDKPSFVIEKVMREPEAPAADG
jgi:hypothetical protein